MYYSWTCDDLGGAVLSAAERMPNPDSPSNAEPAMVTMVDRASSFNIIDYFEDEIVSALNNNTDWTSGIIRLCRFLKDGVLINSYYQARLTVNGAAQTLYCEYGYGDGASFTYRYSRTYTYSEYASLDNLDKCISIIWCKNRNNYTQEAAPGYNGWTYLKMIYSAVQKRIGTWEAPSTQYPYGRMVYTFSSFGLIDDIPGGSVMCYSDNEASRKDQSELAVYVLDTRGTPISVDVNFNGEAELIPCAYDGSYNNDAPKKPDPNEEDPGGNSKPGGGDGGHNRNDNPINLPDLPDLSISDTGMITLYKMSGPDMLDFTSYLFLDITQPGGAWTQMKNLLADPLDFIIGLRAIPIDPPSTRASKPKFGTFTWPSAYNEVDQYISFSCGTVYIEKYYGSCFDYDPYTKIQIFLPGVGFKELPTDDVMGYTIEITYHIDVFTGDCVAFVHKPVAGRKGPQIPQIIAQFGGNIGASMPLARISYDSAVQNGVSMISKALGFVTNAFTQAGSDSGSKVNAGALVEQTTMNAVQSMKRSVERSGSAGDSVGYMSSQKPYIVRTIPQQSLPTNYKELEGYPANLAGPLAYYKGSGYTTVEAIELQGVSGTDKEKEEILSILRGGVLI